MTWPDGSKYQGIFKNGMMEGKGKKTFANGNIYTGSWAEDKTEGEGNMLEVNNNKIIVGVWKKGKLDMMHSN